MSAKYVAVMATRRLQHRDRDRTKSCFGEFAAADAFTGFTGLRGTGTLGRLELPPRRLIGANAGSALDAEEEEEEEEGGDVVGADTVAAMAAVYEATARDTRARSSSLS